MIRVENGYPLPAALRGRAGRAAIVLDPRRPRPPKFSGLTAALLRMELGQSLLLRGVRCEVAHAMLRHAVKRGRVFTVRQGRRGTRVWLVATTVDNLCVVAGGLYDSILKTGRVR